MMGCVILGSTEIGFVIYGQEVIWMYGHLHLEHQSGSCGMNASPGSKYWRLIGDEPEKTYVILCWAL